MSAIEFIILFAISAIWSLVSKESYPEFLMRLAFMVVFALGVDWFLS